MRSGRRHPATPYSTSYKYNDAEQQATFGAGRPPASEQGRAGKGQGIECGRGGDSWLLSVGACVVGYIYRQAGGCMAVWRKAVKGALVTR